MTHQGSDSTGSPTAEPVWETLEEARAAAEEAVQKLDEVSEHMERGGLEIGPRGGPREDDLPDAQGIDVGSYDTGHPAGGPK